VVSNFNFGAGWNLYFEAHLRVMISSKPTIIKVSFGEGGNSRNKIKLLKKIKIKI